MSSSEYGDPYSYRLAVLLTKGRVDSTTEKLVLRVHDACFTSEVLASLKCDCREQLEMAQQIIQQLDADGDELGVSRSGEKFRVGVAFYFQSIVVKLAHCV